MSSHKPHTASEELLGLLRELGGGRDTALLKQQTSVKGAQPLVWPGPPRRRELSQEKLEKHLRDIHREELGLLLKDACLRLLVSDKAIGGMVFMNRVDGVPQEPKKPQEWSRALSRKREVFDDPRGAESEMRLLDRFINPAAGDLPTLRQAAEAGMRLAPSTAFEIYVGRGLEAEGKLEEAASVLDKAHANAVCYRNRLVSASSRAGVASTGGDRHSAMQWYEIASTSCEANALACLGWVFNAAQVGDIEALRRAAGELDGHLEADTSIFAQYLTRTRASLLAGDWKPTEAALRASSMSWKSDYVQELLQLFR